MRILKSKSGTKLWLSKSDTYNWATRPHASWPCSYLRNRRLFAELDSKGDLVDLTIDGSGGHYDCPGDELRAILDDACRIVGLIIRSIKQEIWNAKGRNI